MPAPALPSGYSQAEVDALFADLRAAGLTNNSSWTKSRVPLELQDQWDYVVANPGNTAAAKTAVGAVKGSRGTLLMVIVNTVGTPGNLVLNDAATIGASNTGNQFYSATAASLTAGQVLSFNRECANGITMSSMPTGGNYTFVYA